MEAFEALQKNFINLTSTDGSGQSSGLSFVKSIRWGRVSSVRVDITANNQQCEDED